MSFNETNLEERNSDTHHRRRDSDALSFCDLMTDDDENDENTPPTSDDDENHLFEFLTNPDETRNNEKIIFCGKTIMPRRDHDVTTKTKTLLVRKDSLKKLRHVSSSGSFRFGAPRSPPTVLPADAGGYNRSGSRKKVFSGLVMRLEPKMELSEIRKRQGRRGPPAPMFPVTGSAGERVVTSDTGWCRHERRHYWGSLWCRANFVTAFTKASFGCISH